MILVLIRLVKTVEHVIFCMKTMTSRFVATVRLVILEVTGKSKLAFQKMILYFSTTTDCDPGGKNIECLNGGTCDVTSSLNRFHYQNGSYVEAYAQCTCVRFEDQIFI